MIKKIISITILLLFIGSTITVNANINDDTKRTHIITVDNEGDGDFINIQDALNAAETGDTINVYSGIYRDDDTIDVRKKTSISLIGISHELGSGDDTGKPSVGRIKLADTKNSVIKGFNITHRHEGIIVFTSANNVFSHNNISKCAEGIRFAYLGSSNPNVTVDNVIEYNNVTRNSIGIYIGGRTTIRNNFIANNYFLGMMISGSLNKIRNNHFINNGKYSMYGDPTGAAIGLYESYFSFFENNHFENNVYAFQIGMGYGNFIRENNFINSQEKDVFFINAFNIWSRNYWNESRDTPKAIPGFIYFPIPWIQFDWRPAKEPYDITL